MWPTICFHPSMFMSQRKRPAVSQVATIAVVAPVVVLVAWLVVQSRSPHRGEHYVPGAAGQRGSVSLSPRDLEDQRMTAGLKSTDISDSCFYDTERAAVFVPILVRARGEGAMTFHVTATIAKGADGVHRGGVVKSVVSDEPFLGTMGTPGIWVSIPLDHATWNGGATHCRVSSTMTPGAWFSNDD
jgi:hypothetical protein